MKYQQTANSQPQASRPVSPILVAVVAATAGALTARLFDRWLLAGQAAEIAQERAQLEQARAAALPVAAGGAGTPTVQVVTAADPWRNLSGVGGARPGDPWRGLNADEEIER